jgi:hypothetical protein
MRNEMKSKQTENDRGCLFVLTAGQREERKKEMRMRRTTDLARQRA